MAGIEQPARQVDAETLLKTTSGTPPSGAAPRLMGFLREVVDLAERSFSNPIAFDNSNHLAFMALAFAGKQVVHARSILTLQGSMDASLVARSMVEGLSQLLWAAQSPSDRPLRWRSFAFVRDWRQMRKEQGRGGTVADDALKRIENGIQQFGHLFLNAKAKKALDAGDAMPDDPYTLKWYGEAEREVFEAVGGQAVYRELYGPFSEWHHWRVGGFGPIIRFDERSGRFVFDLSGEAPAMTEASLASAFQCLLQTLCAVDEVVSLGIANELLDLRQRYVSGGPVA